MRRIIYCFLIFITGSAYVYCQNYMLSGLSAYASGDWQSAAVSFQRARQSSKNAEEPFYWLILSYAAAKNYTTALKEASVFIQQYPASSKLPEIVFQSGKCRSFLSEPEKSVDILQGFIQKYPSHKKVAEAYYWIGENFYNMGIIQEARRNFSKVAIDYGFSEKADAAKYKISLLDYAATQDELLKLLKITNRELAELTEEYARKSKSYEQAVSAYQKQIADMNQDPKIAELERTIQEERQQNAALYDRLAMLELKNQELQASLALLQGEAEKNGMPNAEEQIIPDKPYNDLMKKRDVLEALKEKAHKLENLYSKLLQEANR